MPKRRVIPAGTVPPAPGDDSGAISQAIAIISAAFIAGLLLSWRLWFDAARLYPTAPLFGSGLPPLVTSLLAGVLLLALAAAMVGFHRTPAIWLAAGSTAILVLGDQSRLQPWVYEYCILLILLASAKRTASPLQTCRFVIAALYFWSAVQKINLVFIRRIWPDFCDAALRAAPESIRTLFTHAGVAVPVVELVIAIGLLMPRFSKAAACLAVAMHAGILTLLILAHENTVVWPWNIAMALLDIVLFVRTAEERSPLRNGGFRLHGLALVLCGVIPLLSFWDYWDAYLSAALYSGDTIQAVVAVVPHAVQRFPQRVLRSTWQRTRPVYIDLNRWSYDELNVPAYPSERVMKAIGGEVCRAYVLPDRGELRIFVPGRWTLQWRRSDYYDCEMLAP
jgi:hypothetical protein